MGSWSVDMQLEKQLTGAGHPRALAWSPDGRRLASGFRGGVSVFDAEPGQLKKAFEHPGDRVNSVAWTPDGRSLAFGDHDGSIVVLDAATGLRQNEIRGRFMAVLSLACSPDGQLLVAGFADASTRTWNTRTWTLEDTLGSHGGPVRCVAWSPDGQYFATSSDDGTVIIRSRDAGKKLHVLGGGDTWLYAVAWTACGERLIAQATDGKLGIWGRDGSRQQPLEINKSSVLSLAAQPQGRFLASLNEDGAILLYSSGDRFFHDASQDQRGLVREPMERGLALHPTEPLVAAVGSEPESIAIWRFEPQGQPPRPRSLEEWAASDKTHPTLVLSDIVGWTALERTLDRAAPSVLEAHFAQGRTLAKLHGGFVIKEVQDSMALAFDSAADALDFATAYVLDPGDPRIALRMGVHSGPIEIEDDRPIGPTANFLRRVIAKATAKGVWISASTKKRLDERWGRRHPDLEWQAHRDCHMVGFPERYDLFHTVPGGVLGEIEAAVVADGPEVFMCHNSDDKPAVIEIAEELKRRGIRPWLDNWAIQSGTNWMRVLEEHITRIGAAAVFMGDSGLGGFQEIEVGVLVPHFIELQCPIVPVFLPSCSADTHQPLFLKPFQWVDFRKSDPDPMERLIWGITGAQPASDRANGVE